MKLSIAYSYYLNCYGIYSNNTKIFVSFDGNSSSNGDVKIFLSECEIISASKSSMVFNTQQYEGYIVSLIYKEDDIWKANLIKGNDFEILEIIVKQ